MGAAVTGDKRWLSVTGVNRLGEGRTVAEEKLLTTKEVAAMLRTPRETVRYWRSAGKGPAWFKIGRRVLYAESDVLAFIASARESTTARRRENGDGREGD